MMKLTSTEEGGIVLMPVFSQQRADHIDGPRQPRGIIGTFHREAGDMLFLKAVQNI
jgi:hypothetical protein